MAEVIAVFVYGSLLRGEANHGLLRAAEFAGPGRTAPEFTLVDLGPYPGLVAGGATAVLGEVYRVPPEGMAALDALEDHPGVYVRTPIRLEDGRAVLTYVLRPHLAQGRPAVASGDWRTHLRLRSAR